MNPQGLLLQTDPIIFLDSFPPQVLLPWLQYQLHIFFCLFLPSKILITTGSLATEITLMWERVQFGLMGTIS